MNQKQPFKFKKCGPRKMKDHKLFNCVSGKIKDTQSEISVVFNNLRGNIRRQVRLEKRAIKDFKEIERLISLPSKVLNTQVGENPDPINALQALI